MDNAETLATLSTQDTGQINVRENRMDNPYAVSTLIAEDTGQVEKTEGATKNG